MARLFEAPDWESTLAVGSASLIFGAIHAPLVKELWPWTLFATLMGVLLGSLSVASGSLLPAMLAHMLVNYLNLRRLEHIPIPAVAISGSAGSPCSSHPAP